MNAQEWDDMLYDLAHAPADQTTDQREKLAKHMARLEHRLDVLEKRVGMINRRLNHYLP